MGVGPGARAAASCSRTRRRARCLAGGCCSVASTSAPGGGRGCAALRVRKGRAWAPGCEQQQRAPTRARCTARASPHRAPRQRLPRPRRHHDVNLWPHGPVHGCCRGLDAALAAGRTLDEGFEARPASYRCRQKDAELTQLSALHTGWLRPRWCREAASCAPPARPALLLANLGRPGDWPRGQFYTTRRGAGDGLEAASSRLRLRRSSADAFEAAPDRRPTRTLGATHSYCTLPIHTHSPGP